MKKIILNFEKRPENFKELVQAAFNSDLLNFLVSHETYRELEKIERITTYSKNLEISPSNIVFTNEIELKNLNQKTTENKNIGFYVELSTKEDELKIKEISNNKLIDFVIVSAKDWKVIPFENLIAEMHSNDAELIAEVENVKDAELLLKTLEIGVDGILIAPQNAEDVLELKKLFYTIFNIELTEAKVIRIQNIPEAERVCVDTTSLLHPGEGFLVGSTAMGFVLVHAEVFETQFVSSRPFRVNSGDVSAYILVPDYRPERVYRTNYLSELKGGKKVLAVSKTGEARVVSVGRVKIETRPMLRFELEAMRGNKIIPLSCICQNAETIRLIDVDGNAKSVVDIKVGEKVLAHIGPGATHFGTAIKETIIEK